MVSAIGTSVQNAFLASCYHLRKVAEDDYYPREVGDKYNVMEGVGALLYQPFLLCLSRTIRLFETQTGDSSSVGQKVGAVALAVLTSISAGLGYVAKRIGQALPHDKTVRTGEAFVKTSPEKIDQIYELIDQFAKVSKEIGLDYRFNSGTALGAVRHGGIIPWDDDGDFGMLESEKKKLDAAIAEGRYLSHGLRFEYHEETAGYQITFTDEKRAGKPKAALDLFLMRQKPSIGNQPAKVVYVSSFLEDHFPNDWFTQAEWESPEEWKFGPSKQISVLGPNRASTLSYLHRAYGKDCLNTGVATHGHVEITLPFFKVRFSSLGIPVVLRERVQIRDFSPAVGSVYK